MKKVLVAVCAGLLAWASSADVLLWQITSKEAKKYQSSDGHYADYAVLYCSDGRMLDEAVLFAPGYESGEAAMKEQDITILPPGVGDAGKSFWVELYDTHGDDPSDLNKVAWSMPIDYATLTDYLTGTLTALSLVYHPTVVPEPTGGLLVLLGLAGLALRRRR